MLRYLDDHWRGNLTLSTAFWVNNLGLALAVVLLVLGSIAFLPLEPSSASRNWLLLGAAMPAALVLVAIAVWQIVGLWRSAQRYRTGGARRWRRALPSLCLTGALAVTGSLLDGLLWSGRVLLSKALVATIAMVP